MRQPDGSLAANRRKRCRNALRAWQPGRSV